MLPKASSGAIPDNDPVDASKTNQSGFSEILKIKVSPLLSCEVGVKEKLSPTLMSCMFPKIVGG